MSVLGRMRGKFRHANASRDAHITSLRLVIGVLVAIVGWQLHGWDTAPQDLRIHIPPSLASGSTQKWWVVPPSSVYAFATYVWQQVNRWPSDGRADFKRNLHAYSPYLTPSCQRFLQQEYQTRRTHGELTDRVRGVYEIPGKGYHAGDVQVVNRNNWIVTLSLGITESLHGTPVRKLFARYYLRVVRADIDPQHNPFGLQVDCFARSPVRLTVPKPEQTNPGAGKKNAFDAPSDGSSPS